MSLGCYLTVSNSTTSIWFKLLFFQSEYMCPQKKRKKLKGVTVKRLGKFGKLAPNVDLSTVKNLPCKQMVVTEKDVNFVVTFSIL